MPTLAIPFPLPPIKVPPIPSVKPPAPWFPWMAVDAFFPPGATPIVANPAVPYPPLVETSGANFPSDDECTSPDGTRTVLHLADEGGGVMDYVVFVRDNRTHTQRAVFQIRKALQILWSPDSSRVAVSVLTGSNYAEVVILRMDDLKPGQPISTDEAMRRCFTPNLVTAPQYLMALRWTQHGELVVRARGEDVNPPHLLFGYEVSVNTDRLGHPGSVVFLRGYRDAPNLQGTTSGHR